MNDTTHNINLPSGRIRFALEALEEFEAKPNCEVNMTHFLFAAQPLIQESPRVVGEPVCYACLDGAAYAKLSGFDLAPRENLIAEITQYRRDIQSGRLAEGWRFECSLDSFRVGKIKDGLASMHIHDERPFARVSITPYGNSAAEFKRDMHALANDLEEKGL